MKAKSELRLIMVVVASLVYVCEAAPVEWSENGHFYLAVPAPDGITWTDANQAANLLGGHLVTIQDANENDFVFNLVDDEIFWFEWGSLQGPWLGGYQPEGSPEPDGAWRWVTEEPFEYTNWFEGLPDNWAWNDCTEQDHLHFLWRFSRQPTWNDNWDNCPTKSPHGYIIEFSAPGPLPAEWPVADGGNGHTYLPVAVPQGITWFDAYEMASLIGGHLVTITSPEENNFVFNLIDDDIYWHYSGPWAAGPWIGGFQLPGAPEPDGGWRWIPDEAFVYANWGQGQPNNVDRNVGENENCMHFGYAQARVPTWNDIMEDPAASVSQGYRVQGYVIEFSGPYNCTEEIIGDLNNDCKVDLKDLAIMASRWLECSRLPKSDCW